MGRKKDEGASINLDSFLDIMTCLVGILVLIIILTGIDAAQIKVLVPTPMQNTDFDGKPIYIEANKNQLFKVPLGEIQELSNSALKEIAQKAEGSQVKLLSLISGANVETETYSIDLTYALMGQLALRHKPEAKGYPIVDYEKEGPEQWFGKILASVDPEQEMLTFLVRDDSFEVFKLARGLAWLKKIEVSYELFTPNEAIKFGLLGDRTL